MLAQAVERLAAQWREELHLPLQAMLHLLGDGRSALQPVLPFWHGEVPELLAGFLARAIVGFLQQGLAIPVGKLNAAVVHPHLCTDVFCFHDDVFRNDEIVCL